MTVEGQVESTRRMRFEALADRSRKKVFNLAYRLSMNRQEAEDLTQEAFFRAYRAAQDVRPASARERIPPEQYLAYRDAVAALEAAFDEAERAAGAAPRPTAPPTGIWQMPTWIPLRMPTSD